MQEAKGWIQEHYRIRENGLSLKEGVKDLPYEGIHVVQKAQSLYRLRGITSNMEKKEFYTS